LTNAKPPRLVISTRFKRVAAFISPIVQGARMAVKAPVFQQLTPNVLLLAGFML
jgi:hypothetical protein